MVDLLRQRPRRAGELSAPAMSKHPKVLRVGTLIEQELDEQDARIRIYRLRRQPSDELEDWLRQVQAPWTDQLGAFKAHVDGLHGKPEAAKARAEGN